MDDDTLKIRLKAVPEDGKVNTELLDFLEREADEKWEIVAGWTSRRKEVKYRRKTTLRDLIKCLQ